jgi:hypothetical protein
LPFCVTTRKPSQRWIVSLSRRSLSVCTTVFLIIAHDRRRILYFNVTKHPTSMWIVQQLREACRPSLRSGRLTPTLRCENAGHGYSILINTRDALTRFPPERIFALAHSSYDHVRIQAVATGDVSILCVDEILAAQLKRTNSCSRRTE